MKTTPVRKQTTFKPYDFTWARRTRHAFRLIVALSVVFTFALWFSEAYLRYDRSETQYRMALTLHPAQARPILRTVVRREMEDGELPSSRYVEVLAQVEEADYILENYELAYKANPRNAALVMNYGSALYQDGQYEEARERFREAGVTPPRNVLPRYLEAAALAAGMAPDADLSDVIALITRANASEDPVLFPKPLWHESLPKQGQRYLELRRESARRMMALPARCAAMIGARARESIAQGETRDWDVWLENVAAMGVRLMSNNPGDSPATAPQMIAALQIQRDAVAVRADISQLTGGVVAPDLNDALLRLDEALDAFDAFEIEYHQMQALQHFRLFMPLTLLFETLLAFLFFYAVGWFLHYLGAGGKSARAAPHIWIGKYGAALGLAVMLAMLVALMAAHNTTPRAGWEAHVPVVWRLTLLVMLALGLAYPPLLVKIGNMPGHTQATEPEEEDAATPQHSRFGVLLHYAGIYGCLLRRFMGVLMGGLVIMVCVWLLIYRVTYDIYPFQTELIASGPGMETDILIEEVRRYLAGH